MQSLKINKNGIANVVSVVFLVLLGVVAVSLIWGIVTNVVVLLSPEKSGLDCLDMQLENVFTIQKACWKDSELEVTVSRSLDEIYFTELNFVFGDESFVCKNSCGNCLILNAGETKTYYFAFDKKPENVILHVGGCFLNEKNINAC